MKHAILLGVAIAALVLNLPGCGLPDGCLAEGTMVSTPNGNVAIEDLRIGDTVWSVDPDTGRRVTARVVRTRSAVRNCVRLTTASGRSVIATHDHPFYAPHARRYMELGTLAARSDPCVLSGTHTLISDRIVDFRPAEGRRRVYDITLDGDLHNFLADGVLVHNKSEPPPPTPTIAESVMVENVGTGDLATFESRILDGLAMGPPVMLARDPFSGGVGIVHVTSTEAFDHLLIASSSPGAGFGTLVLALPMSTTTVDLRVTLLESGSSLMLAIAPMRAGVEGMPATIEVPRDG